jgi:hypothetical protein
LLPYNSNTAGVFSWYLEHPVAINDHFNLFFGISTYLPAKRFVWTVNLDLGVCPRQFFDQFAIKEIRFAATHEWSGTRRSKQLDSQTS